VQTLNYPNVQETLYREVLDNGLEVIVLPKEGFNKTYATFSTKYGSVDNRFSVGSQPPVKVPDGRDREHNKHNKLRAVIPEQREK